MVEGLNQALQSQDVAIFVKTGHPTNDDILYIGLVSERFPRMWIAHMHFNRWDIYSQEGIPNSDTRMGICSRIDQNTIHDFSCSLDHIDQFSLRITLGACERDLVRLRFRYERLVNLIQRSVAVDSSFPVAKQVQIRAIKYEDFHQIIRFKLVSALQSEDSTYPDLFQQNLRTT